MVLWKVPQELGSVHWAHLGPRAQAQNWTTLSGTGLGSSGLSQAVQLEKGEEESLSFLLADRKLVIAEASNFQGLQVSAQGFYP